MTFIKVKDSFFLILIKLLRNKGDYYLNYIHELYYSNHKNMLEIFSIYILLFILILVIPTILTGLLRLNLYKHLAELKKQTYSLYNVTRSDKETDFNRQLREKFERVSNKLENVNTIALIDSLFYEQTFNFLGRDVRCDKAEYITKVLPNLLLAFGLLGTFIGITLNLGSISNFITDNSREDVTILIDQLKTPLESMSIAFISSLVALICSSTLVIVNIFWNVSLEKLALINNLENYFDNDHQLKQKGETKLDKAVDRMVQQQTEFLTRFHENVGQVLERTFKQATDQMIAQNNRSHELSMSVYQNFLNSSSALHTGANVFKQSTEQMSNLFKKFNDSIDLLELSATKIKDSAIKIENSKFADNLGDLTNNLLNVQEKFSQSTTSIASNIQEFVEQNRRSQNLADNIYQNLALFVQQLEKTLVVFNNLTDGIKDQNLSKVLNEINQTLQQSQNQFKELNQLLEQKISLIDANIEKLPKSLAVVDTLNENLVKFLEMDQKINQEIKQLESYLDAWQSNNRELLKDHQTSTKNIMVEQQSSLNDLESLKEINTKLVSSTKILRDIRNEMKKLNTIEEKDISFRLVPKTVQVKP